MMTMATNDIMANKSNPRSCILQVGMHAGRLCELANSHPAMVEAESGTAKLAAPTCSDSSMGTFSSKDHLVTTMADLLVSLWLTSCVLKLNMIVAIHNKLKLNEKKYPVEHCKGKAGKYTHYSHLTGITTANQVTEVGMAEANRGQQQQTATPLQDTTSTQPGIPEWRVVLSLPQVTAEVPALASTIAQFATARLWTKYHTPRNIVMALLGEVGELSELLQFKGDQNVEDLVEALEPKELDKLSQEIADVSIYLLRLATVCDVVEPLCEALNGMSTPLQEEK
jgi:dCTP diphosphatase